MLFEDKKQPLSQDKKQRETCFKALATIQEAPKITPTMLY